jgi:hypothetical protein
MMNNNFNGFGESGFSNGDLKIIDVDLDGDNDIIYSGKNFCISTITNFY